MDVIEDVKRRLLVKVNLTLIAVSFSVFLGLLQVPTKDFDKELLRTLYCTSIIFPFNIYFGFILQQYEGKQISKLLYNIFKWCTLFTIMVASGGLVSLISHFSETASVAFTISGLVAIFLLVIFLDYKKS